MIHRTKEGIYSFVKTRGLFICVNPVSKIYKKVTASYITVDETKGLIKIHHEPIKNVDPDYTVVEVLFIDDYGKRWACTEKEFL